MLKSILQPIMNPMLNSLYGNSYFLYDSFTASNGTTINNHLGDHGYGYVPQPFNGFTNIAQIFNNRLRGKGSENFYQINYNMPVANYSVSATITCITNLGLAGVIARASTSQNTYYLFRYQDAPNWRLEKKVNGVTTQLGSIGSSLTSGTTVTAKLVCKGNLIQAYLNNVLTFSVTDNDITQAGRAGIAPFWATTDTTGCHMDNLIVELV